MCGVGVRHVNKLFGLVPPLDCNANHPIIQKYPYFSPNEKGWQECVCNCLMTNSFFRMVGDGSNLWKLHVHNPNKAANTPPKVSWSSKYQLELSIIFGLQYF